VPFPVTKSLIAKLFDYLYSFIRIAYEIVSVFKPSLYIVNSIQFNLFMFHNIHNRPGLTGKVTSQIKS
jgi:hypothetical protein